MNAYNFTERVRKVLAMAREESRNLSHEYVGTEHILLAVISEGDGVASTVMQNLGVDQDAIRQKLHEVVKKGRARDRDATGSDLPYTSRAKKVLELAMAEARELAHKYVGTEHLLLGLMREEKGIAAQVLVDAGLTVETARAEVLSILGTAVGEGPDGSAGTRSGPVSIEVSRIGTPRSQVAFVTLWWTLGIVILLESARPFVRQLTGAEPITPHLATLAGAEIIGALLFLSPSLVKYGAAILLAVFAVAIVVHLARGEFPGSLLVYAAGAFYVLQRKRGVV
jgi:hypothetical protein